MRASYGRAHLYSIWLDIEILLTPLNEVSGIQSPIMFRRGHIISRAI